MLCMDMKLGLSLKEECEARMRRSTTRDGSKKRHIRSRHRSSSSSSSRSSRKHRRHSHSSSSSHGSRSRRKSKRSGHRRSYSRSGSDRSVEVTDRFGRRANPFNVTNSKDPKSVASRLFIGSLPVDLTRDEVDARFSRYGKILGITLLNGYGFVQFSEEEDALRAVEGEKDSLIRGQRFDVKLAAEGKKKGHGHSDEDHHRRSSREMDYHRPPYPYPDPYSRGLPPPPHMDPYRGALMPPMDPYIRGPPPPPHMDPYHRGPPPLPYHRGPPVPSDPFTRGPPFDPYARGPPPPGDPFRRPYPDPYPYPSPSGYSPQLPPPPPTVDCEIVVLDEKQRSYAESIRKRLMSAGIVTEMNILPSGVDVLTTLEDATRRRLLFAIIVNDQNEIHRSITVNILHGLTQEHRNMPMEDAITLVTRSYDKYMLEKQDRISSDKSQRSAEDMGMKKCPDFLRPTANTLYLLNLLADNRYLTVDELDTVVDYLQLRRDRLVKSFSSSSVGSRPVGPTTPPLPIRKGNLEDLPMSGIGMKPREPDLKSILGMLHTEKTASVETVKPVESYSTSSLPSSAILNTSINFNNPTVQQALDNLINSGPSLLKSLSDAGKVPASVPSTVSQPYDEKGRTDPYESWDSGYGGNQQYRGGIY